MFADATFDLSLSGVMLNGISLNPGKDFSSSGNTLVLKAEFLNTLLMENSPYTLQIQANGDDVLPLEILVNNGSLLPVITKHPERQTVTPGQNGIFATEAESLDGGVLSYQWQFSLTGGKNAIWTVLPDGNDSEYLMDGSDNMYLRCRVGNQKDSLPVEYAYSKEDLYYIVQNYGHVEKLFSTASPPYRMIYLNGSPSRYVAKNKFIWTDNEGLDNEKQFNERYNYYITGGAPNNMPVPLCDFTVSAQPGSFSLYSTRVMGDVKFTITQAPINGMGTQFSDNTIDGNLQINAGSEQNNIDIGRWDILDTKKNKVNGDFHLNFTNTSMKTFYTAFTAGID